MTMYRDYSGAPKSNPTKEELAARRAAYIALPLPPKIKLARAQIPRVMAKKPTGIVHPRHLASYCRSEFRRCVYRVPGKARYCNGWCEWYGQTIPVSQKRPAECIKDARAGLIDEKTEAAE